MITPLFGGIAATGAIARTATNIRNGGNSPISGIIHSFTLIIILIVLAPLAMNIPLATLSAILFVVAWNMSEVPHFLKLIKRAPKADVVILLITFGLTVFADLVVAVNIGVILATLHFVRRMAASVEIKASSQDELTPELMKHGLTQLPHELAVYALEGPFFFAAAEAFERVMNSIQDDPKILVIRLKWVPFMDITGIQALEEIVSNFKNKGIHVVICGANSRVANKLTRAGIVNLIGQNHIYPTFEIALAKSLEELAQTGDPSKS
jgi:sulfate permease, SulP family